MILSALPESLRLLAAPLTEFVITEYMLENCRVMGGGNHIMVFLYW